MKRYGRRLVVDLPYELALAEAMWALHEEMIEVIGHCDVREFIDRRLHHPLRRYVLLEVASPELTLHALRRDLEVGPVLPTTIALFELADGETAVIAAEPFGGLAADPQWRETDPSLAAIADQAGGQLARALRRLQQAADNHAPHLPGAIKLRKR